MAETTTPHSSSDNFWKELRGSPAYSYNKHPHYSSKGSFSVVDEAPDFYDPLSDLSLFLAGRIKEEMSHCGNSKKWSAALQEELLQKITPDFQKRFPRFRLGVSAVRKIWEKIAHYSQQLRSQKEAIAQDGKLNIHFLIRENLRSYLSIAHCNELPPYHYTHQLAMKISECIATIDCARPKLDHLTKMIWAGQKHLLTGTRVIKGKSPYEEYDKIDELIAKTILEITSKEPFISQRELESRVKETLGAWHEFPSFASLDAMVANVSALLAEKLYSFSRLHTHFLEEQRNAIQNFIRRHIALCSRANPGLTHTERERRIIALYGLASQLPKHLKREDIEEAILSVYPHPQDKKKAFPQALYAFIAAESVLMKNDEYCHSKDYVVETLISAYEEAKNLPELKGKEIELLEIVLWKIVSESESLLETLNFRIGQKIEEEIANILVENPTQSFSSLVHLTVQFFRRAKEVVEVQKYSEVERKIHLWTIQNDMLSRSIQLDTDSPLYKLICEKCRSSNNPSHKALIGEVVQEYLKQFPELASYAPQVGVRAWILYKHIWYTTLAQPDETSFERFLKWHSHQLPSENLSAQLEEICNKTLPLIPFDAASFAEKREMPLKR